MVPTVALPFATPFTDHSRAPPPVAAAEKCSVWPGDAAAFCGWIVTEPACCGVGGGCEGAGGLGGTGDAEVRPEGTPPPQPTRKRNTESPRQGLRSRPRATRRIDIRLLERPLPHWMDAHPSVRCYWISNCSGGRLASLLTITVLPDISSISLNQRPFDVFNCFTTSGLTRSRISPRSIWRYILRNST